ncbi:unnamed protein product [Lampetra fluviatilis]
MHREQAARPREVSGRGETAERRLSSEQSPPSRRNHRRRRREKPPRRSSAGLDSCRSCSLETHGSIPLHATNPEPPACQSNTGLTTNTAASAPLRLATRLAATRHAGAALGSAPPNSRQSASTFSVPSFSMKREPQHGSLCPPGGVKQVGHSARHLVSQKPWGARPAVSDQTPLRCSRATPSTLRARRKVTARNVVPATPAPTSRPCGLGVESMSTLPPPPRRLSPAHAVSRRQARDGVSRRDSRGDDGRGLRYPSAARRQATS